MSWYYSVNGERFGPYDEDALKKLIADGTLSQDSYVWTAGMGKDWSTVSNVPELAAQLPPAEDAKKQSAGSLKLAKREKEPEPDQNASAANNTVLDPETEERLDRAKKLVSTGSVINAGDDELRFWPRFLTGFFIWFIPITIAQILAIWSDAVFQGVGIAQVVVIYLVQVYVSFRARDYGIFTRFMMGGLPMFAIAIFLANPICALVMILISIIYFYYFIFFEFESVAIRGIFSGYFISTCIIGPILFFSKYATLLGK